MSRTCTFCEDSITMKFEDTPFEKCMQCGLFINTPMDPNQIKQVNKNFLLSACNNPETRKRRLGEASNLQLATLEKYVEVGSVYDVGAASAFFMKAAIDSGWEAHGNEISVKGIHWAKENYNIDVDYGFLEELDLPNDYYNAVVLWNTLEHTYNPRTTLEISYNMLKKGGLIYIKVPNKKDAVSLMRYYEKVHLFEFTDECLCMHLENMGFEEVWKEINDINPRSGVRAGIYLYRKL